MRRISRRDALRQAALVAGGAGLAPLLAPPAVWAASTAAPDQVVPFAGRHQAGIETPAQAHACVAVVDFSGTGRADLTQLLREWSAAAARLTAGLPASAQRASVGEPPADSGEALGLLPARLTITFGFGPTLFTKVAAIAAQQPALLRRLPPFSTDRLETAISDGDVAVQACADDPMVALHAVRMLLAIGTSRVRLRWMLRGFNSTDRAQPGTGRNLMGFKDGTANPTPAEPVYAPTVWVQPADEPRWLRDGSYLVVRRIRMRLGHWDASAFGEQEQTFGRARSNGAPLSGGQEFTPPDFSARVDGVPVIAADAHIRRAHFAFNEGARILRRGYSYSDGVAPSAAGDLASGGIDAGLLFLAYMRDPQQFVRIQSSLASLDHLNEYVVHVGSAIFAVPPGASRGGFVGETLLD